jgi:hypothetical protein
VVLEQLFQRRKYLPCIRLGKRLYLSVTNLLISNKTTLQNLVWFNFCSTPQSTNSQ